MVEQGWLGIDIPESFGGLELPPSFSAAFSRELGRANCVTGYLPAIVVSASLVARSGGSSALLEPVLAGRETFGTALFEPDRTNHIWDVAAGAEILENGGYRLNGHKTTVLLATSASAYLVVARLSGRPMDRDGLGLFLVPRNVDGLREYVYETIDGAHSADLTLTDVDVASSACISGNAGDAIDRTFARALTFAAAEIVGVVESGFDMTVDYLKQRKQFGQPLIAFQALRHRLVDHLCSLRSIEALSDRMTVELESGNEEWTNATRRFDYIADRAMRMMEDFVQLHGAIGMTQEYRLGAYFKRVAMLGAMLRQSI